MAPPFIVPFKDAKLDKYTVPIINTYLQIPYIVDELLTILLSTALATKEVR